MAGKGQRRREKNYRAAHEGLNSRLPPPPESSSLDALPSKLRKLIAVTSSPPSQGAGGSAKTHVGVLNKARKGNGEVKTNKDEGPKSRDIDKEEANAVDSKKRKRKKTKVDDLRFTAEMEKLGVRSSRKDRKKEYFKAKKKKQKKGNAQDDEFDAPRRDVVKFGEIVQAPPKLASIPRAPKKALQPSQERLRLQAVEAYRNRRKWESRPGLHLPSLVGEEPSSL